MAIRTYHDSGNTTTIRAALAVLAALFDRLGRYEAGGHHRRFRRHPLLAVSRPEISTAIAHLRDVLGDQTYESLARKGETMTTAAMVTYALRPNRPGPSRTERCLEIDHIRDTSRLVGVRSRRHPGGTVSKVSLRNNCLVSPIC